MAELAEIRSKIADNEVRLNQAEDEKDREMILVLNARLTELQKKKNILLASKGEFQLLSLHIALLNSIPSTFMIHMMTDNT
jgi:hypothetical protein